MTDKIRVLMSHVDYSDIEYSNINKVGGLKLHCTKEHFNPLNSTYHLYYYGICLM